MATDSIELFENRINALISCKLILSDRHISNLLKCITVIPTFTDCIKETLAVTGYKTEFSRAKVTVTKSDGTLQSKLKLPIEKSRLFTFVTCLLTEVDCGRRSFVEFLSDYFYSGDSNASYELFCQQVLKPYKKSGEAILRDVDPSSLDLESIEKADKFFVSEKVFLSAQQISAICDIINRIKVKFDSYTFPTALKKTECFDELESFHNAIKSRNPKLIYYLWIGLKNTAVNIVGLEIDDLYDCLTEYKLI
ncbi:MAG: hypothetical protein RR086_05245 [Clostridia bacterium]